MKRHLLLASLSTIALALPACSGGDKKGEEKAAEKAAADGGGEADADKGEGKEGGGEEKAGDASEKPAPVAAGAGGGGGGAPAETTKYVPDGAMFIAHLDIKSISKTPMWEANKAAMASDPDAKNTIEALKKCNLDIDQFDAITLAGDEQEHAVVVAVGKGMGNADNLKCVGETMKEDLGEGNWAIEDRDGKKVVVIDGGEQLGHLVDENTLVVTSKEWNEAVKGLIGGSGSAAVDGALKVAVSNADTSKNIWFAATVPAEAAGELKGSPAEGLEYVAGSLDMSTGMGLTVKAGTPSAAKAEELKNFLAVTYGQYKGMAAMIGIPPHLAEKVAFGTADKAATASLNLTAAEVDELKKAMEGAGGGGPPPAKQ
jgi:hypothetical protein